MKDEIIVVIRTLESIMDDEEIMKIINTSYDEPLYYAKKSLINELGNILVKEELR